MWYILSISVAAVITGFMETANIEANFLSYTGAGDGGDDEP